MAEDASVEASAVEEAVSEQKPRRPAPRKKAKKVEEEAPWPLTLPKLLARYQEEDGAVISYECQWGKGGLKETHTVAVLVQHYGERVVERVTACDKKAGVCFVAESLVGKREGKEGTEYRVRWRGYPAEFDTWELVDDVWEKRDDEEEHQRQLIEAFEQ